MKPEVVDDLCGEMLGGRYVVVAPIGAGATAKVYLADDTALHRRVALKVLHAAAAHDHRYVHRFKSEAMTVAALNHPHIMGVYDAVIDVERPYLVLEFLGGGSLRAMLDHQGPLSLSQVLEIGLSASKGLTHAHAKGLVHRDIKPANLLFGEEGRLRVADFGMARALSEASWTEPEGMMLGTAKYASPEQALGESIDGRSDVYSLAVVLIEAVTGAVPFAGEHPAALLRARIDSDLVVPEEMGRLGPVLERAGRLDPEERCDAGELELSLLAAAGDLERPEALPLMGAISADVLEMRRAALERYDPDGTEPLTHAVQHDAESDEGSPVPQALASAEVQSLGIDIPIDEHEQQDVANKVRRWPYVLSTIVMVLGAVGAGAYWYFVIRTPVFTVPDVVATRLEDAQSRVTDAGFEVVVKNVRRDGTGANDVVAQDPIPGARQPRGSKIELSVSLGATLVEVPSITSAMTEQDALAALQAVGLVVGARNEVNDEKIDSGKVVASKVTVAPDVSGQVPKGTAVDLTISLGPEPRTIPNGLIGEPLDITKRKFTSLGLRFNVTERYDNDMPKGSVLSLSKQPGSQVERGTLIEVSVSIGPEPIAIPDVHGQNGIQATTTLQRAGFSVSKIDGPPANEVLLTEPAAGEKRVRNTPVRIVTKTL